MAGEAAALGQHRSGRCRSRCLALARCSGIDLQIVHSCNPRGSDRNGRIWPAPAAALQRIPRLAFYCWPRAWAVLATPLLLLDEARVSALRENRFRPPRMLRRSVDDGAPQQHPARCSGFPPDSHLPPSRCVPSEPERATCHHEPAAAGRGPGTSGGTSESRALGPPRTRGLNESNVLCRRGGFLGRVPRLQGARATSFRGRGKKSAVGEETKRNRRKGREKNKWLSLF